MCSLVQSACLAACGDYLFVRGDRSIVRIDSFFVRVYIYKTLNETAKGNFKATLIQ